MKSFTRLINKKRAISPVIAVILLIGLAVAAAAAIFLVVLPLFAPSSNLQMDDAYVVYDDEYTTAADLEEGYGKGTLVLSNTGTADIDIVSLKVYHASSVLGPWTEITEHDGLLISQTNPYTVETLATLEELDVRFLIPDENDNNTVFYRITITTSDGDELDTAAEDVDETDMQLVKDRPDIDFAGTLDYLRREEPIRPSQVSDNSEIKNVTYEVFFPNGTLAVNKTIEPPNTLWQWIWDTRNDSTEGLHNGTYDMRMTVSDYAGLSASTSLIPLTLDNDYVDPNILATYHYSLKNGEGLAEVGESYTIIGTITDSGCGDSDVGEAFLHYKLNDSSITYAQVRMDETSGNNWTANIPAQFIDSTALDNNLTFYITAEDLDDNQDNSSDQTAGVIDTTGPDFTVHTPILSGTENQVIRINATVVDKDNVEFVTLVWRERNDTGLIVPDTWVVSTNISGTGNTWEFEIPTDNATLDGLDYYLNATDPSENPTVKSYDGTPVSPYHIVIPDLKSPEITFQNPLPDEHSAGTNLTISVFVADNDWTFSAWDLSPDNESGEVSIHYRKGSTGAYEEVTMNHISLDSSYSGSGLWEGVIPKSIFNINWPPYVEVYISATDQKGNPKISEIYTITVLPGEQPIFNYVEDSVGVYGTSNGTLEFKVKNNAGTAAGWGTITDIQIELYNFSKYNYLDGNPLTIEINATGATNPVWANSSSPSTAVNGTKLNLGGKSFTVGYGSEVTFIVVYANSSGGYYDLYDFEVNVTLYYDYSLGSGSSPITDTPFRTPLSSYLFVDDFSNGDVSAWEPYSYPAGTYFFTAVESPASGFSWAYSGDCDGGGSTANVWSWISDQKYELGFEVVLKFWSYNGAYENALIILGNSKVSTTGTIYGAGARVGAADARIESLTIGGGWSAIVTTSYTWGVGELNWMKVSVAADKTVTVYSEDAGSWTQQVSTTISGLDPTGVYIGLAVNNGYTDYDDVYIYYYGDAPTGPPSPAPLISAPLNSVDTTNSPTEMPQSSLTPEISTIVILQRSRKV